MISVIKYIFSDMDGTLLDADGNLPPDFAEVMAMLAGCGVTFAPTSGRQYNALCHQMEQYRDKFLFIAENGTLAMQHGKELFSSPIPLPKVHKVLDKVRDMAKIYPVLCGKQGAYIQPYWQRFTKGMQKYYTHYQIVDDFSHIDDEIIKIALCDCERGDADHTIYPYMQDMDDSLKVMLSSNYWVDVTNAGINKGSTIQKLQSILQVRPEECAAFGDYLNDLEMMESVYYSFAMDNALPEIKEKARFLAKSNLQNGVMEAVCGLKEKNLI